MFLRLRDGSGLDAMCVDASFKLCTVAGRLLSQWIGHQAWGPKEAVMQHCCAVCATWLDAHWCLVPSSWAQHQLRHPRLGLGSR